VISRGFHGFSRHFNLSQGGKNSILVDTKSSMFRYFLFILLGVCTIGADAQTNEKLVVIPAGIDPAKGFPIADRYRLPQFANGYLITIANKRSQPLKLNFNLFSGNPQFIDDKGDTLFIDKELAKYIQVQGLTYLHEFTSDYYEIVMKTEPVSLAIKREWKIIRREGVSNNGYETIGAIQRVPGSYNAAGTNQGYGNGVTNETLTFRRDSTYFFIDSKERVYKANDNSLLKIFPHNRVDLQQYFKENDVNFDKEGDIRKVLAFIVPKASQ
jgi:hypothetical protein